MRRTSECGDAKKGPNARGLAARFNAKSGKRAVLHTLWGLRGGCLHCKLMGVRGRVQTGCGFGKQGLEWISF